LGEAERGKTIRPAIYKKFDYKEFDLRPVFAYPVPMEVGGYNDVPDWPKMGPSLLIATCLIVAIRTAKWSATIDAENSNCELDKEIDFAANVARRVLTVLTAKSPSIFPSRKRPWYKATSEDHPE
jgi:hypothetical protein